MRNLKYPQHEIPSELLCKAFHRAIDGERRFWKIAHEKRVASEKEKAAADTALKTSGQTERAVTRVGGDPNEPRGRVAEEVDGGRKIWRSLRIQNKSKGKGKGRA